MRKPVIAGNWKMFKTINESVNTALALKPFVANANHCEVVIAPVFTAGVLPESRCYLAARRIGRQFCFPRR